MKNSAMTGTNIPGRAWLAIAAAACLALPAPASARIEIILMGRTRGVKPPPFPGERLLRGTPFGHMALYVESAARDDDLIIRQARQGEPGGLVLTVDKELRDSFFTAFPRDEFFYGGLDSGDLPGRLTRDEIAAALGAFDRNYGHLYHTGPGISGFGQDYGVLYVRKVWGVVYPTTREEEARIIEYWQEQRHDEFIPSRNNCASIINRAMCYAGLTNRKYFWRAYACYNSWTHWTTYFVTAGMKAKAPDGTYLRRDGTFVTEYPQLESDAIIPSGRPFNAWSLWNMEYLLWLAPRGTLPVTGEVPVDYAAYPTGGEPASGTIRYGLAEREGVRYLSRGWEFIRLWPQTIGGILWLLSR